MTSFLKRLAGNTKAPPAQPKHSPPKEAKKADEDIWAGKADAREVKDTLKVEASSELERFHDCCTRGDLDSCKTILASKKVKVSDKGNLGFQALHWAGRGGHKEIVEFLLQSKADPNPANDAGDTPLHLAAAKGYHAAILPIVKAGGDPTVANKEGKTAMDLANSEDTREALRGRDPSAGAAITMAKDDDDDDDSD